MFLLRNEKNKKTLIFNPHYYVISWLYECIYKQLCMLKRNYKMKAHFKFCIIKKIILCIRSSNSALYEPDCIHIPGDWRYFVFTMCIRLNISYFHLYIIWEESIGITKIFSFWFLMSLHILGCPEHDLTIFAKWHKFCGCTSAKTDGWICVKFNI